jgi:hypothetical protein
MHSPLRRRLAVNRCADGRRITRVAITWSNGYPAGCRMPDAGCRMPDAGCRMPDAGCRMPDAGCRMPDAGCRMNGI